jgi:hypothetical protein
MEIYKKNHSEFENQWDRFVKKNQNASWAYLPLWRKYQQHYSKYIVENLSFLISHENEPLCICPLFLEQIDNKLYFSCANDYLVAPIFKKGMDNRQFNKTFKICFSTVDEIAAREKVQKTMFAIDPLSSHRQYNYLMEVGYINTSLNTSIIDLTQPLDILWKNLRKSYKSLINNGKKKFEIEIVDSKNLNREAHEEYRRLHHKTSGKVTRIHETWEFQYKMVENDYAILVGLKDNGKYIAFSYFYHHNGGIYYGSSSDDPDYKTVIPIEHTIIWSAIKYYKERDFSELNIGIQFFGNQLFSFPNEKDLSISFFKRGFGGINMTFNRGIKYYDEELMKNEFNKHFK